MIESWQTRKQQQAAEDKSRSFFSVNNLALSLLKSVTLRKDWALRDCVTLCEGVHVSKDRKRERRGRST